MTRSYLPDSGALVISLDFELHWGVRETRSVDGPYRNNLLGARAAVPALLALFDEFEIAATWATVGFLFASDRSDLERWRPKSIPSYRNECLDPFREEVGECELTDPFHFAPTLIRQIASARLQEIATHTYSHYYCLAPGHSEASLRADLQSASIAARHHGIELKSIVFPRNQYNPQYDNVLLEAGLETYRGPQNGWQYNPTLDRVNQLGTRLGRAVDSYVAAAPKDPTSWAAIRQPNGLCNIPANAFVRPFRPWLQHLENLRRARLTRMLERASRDRKVIHLWWHPHNFGTHLMENLEFLRGILQTYADCRDRDGLRSLTMADVSRSLR